VTDPGVATVGISGDDRRARAKTGVKTLQRWYRWWAGQWRTTGWWNAANALTTIVRYTQATGDREHSRAIGWTFRMAPRLHPKFINKFYDDMAWWALGWLDTYDLTGKQQYATAARVIFEQMTTGWDDHCGGGLWWNTDRKYKNAIANELFLSVAARLHKTGEKDGSQFLDWARREWDWFNASGMIGPSGLVNDGLTAECQNNGKPCYTYNQGVVLGGLSALYEITSDQAYLRAGEAIADAAIKNLVSAPSSSVPGILADPGDQAMAQARSHGDGSQFKGIFIRNLHDFTRHSNKPGYRDFILRNADSLWENSRNSKDQLGLLWTGPFDVADASRQSSALDALIAAAALA
jgi:predicted alpha-1,6-mannanase (GH76 family)